MSYDGFFRLARHGCIHWTLFERSVAGLIRQAEWSVCGDEPVVA